MIVWIDIQLYIFNVLIWLYFYINRKKLFADLKIAKEHETQIYVYIVYCFAIPCYAP